MSGFGEAVFAVFMERDNPDSRKSRISTIDAIGQKAAVTREFPGDRSMFAMRQPQKFPAAALNFSNRPVADNVAFVK